MKTRLLLAPCLAAALLIAAVAFPSAPAAAPAPTATKACAASGLVVWAGPEPGGGAAGSVYYRIEFTNLSTATCTLSGFPKVNAVDLKGKRVGAFATAEPGKKATKVTLAPGQAATAQLRIVDALNFPANKCKATTAAGLRVGIPGGSGNKVAPLAFETCKRATTKTLSVGAVTAG
ncbi:MAG: DUF4232 domain-containing protein [Actinobacteria bacterium]|nr:DUF4232 domain-containing protein [Actinomycetota bacterium]